MSGDWEQWLRTGALKVSFVLNIVHNGNRTEAGSVGEAAAERDRRQFPHEARRSFSTSISGPFPKSETSH
jgi:hypothetical protein